MFVGLLPFCDYIVFHFLLPFCDYIVFHYLNLGLLPYDMCSNHFIVFLLVYILTVHVLQSFIVIEHALWCMSL